MDPYAQMVLYHEWLRRLSLEELEGEPTWFKLTVWPSVITDLDNTSVFMLGGTSFVVDNASGELLGVE